MKLVKIPILLIATICTFSCQAQEIELVVQHSIQVSFNSEAEKAYQVFTTPNVDRTNWQPLGEPVQGNGDKITFFYNTKEDQKVFFKVEGGEGSQPGELNKRLNQIESILNVIKEDKFVFSFENFDGVDLSWLDYKREIPRPFLSGNSMRAEFSSFKVANFNGANLDFVEFLECDFESAEFRNTNAKFANFSGSDLTNATFVNANIRGAFFGLIESKNTLAAKFLNTNFTDSNFFQAYVKGTDIEGAIGLSSKDRLVWEMQNTQNRNQDFIGMDLSGANLSGVFI